MGIRETPKKKNAVAQSANKTISHPTRQRGNVVDENVEPADESEEEKIVYGTLEQCVKRDLQILTDDNGLIQSLH